ncbi:MAG: hypothetical protein E6J90_45130 [Deltaproteobacteria bacterium]|nr:MAG: hypothetical protein E6J90_45130 [Deltaproteobacteria bacterium]TMQ09718.1 MAG: hypothetical protein E6J91_29360 [Deltaproteobacteria bacterium]
MKTIIALMISGLAALTITMSLSAQGPAASRPAATAAADAEALLTAWRCPITGQFFTNPFTCKANCSGFTCQAVSQ